MEEVILKYPLNFEEIAGEGAILADLGFIAQTNLKTNEITVWSFGDEDAHLEDIFTEKIISSLRENGVIVEIK